MYLQAVNSYLNATTFEIIFIELPLFGIFYIQISPYIAM